MRWTEGADWPPAGGVPSVFVLAVLLKDAAWPVGFAVTAVACWAAAGCAVTGGAVGAAGWAFVTGFDVDKTGDLGVAGLGGAARPAVLIGLGPAAGAAGRWPSGEENDHARRGLRPADGGGVRPARPGGEGRGEAVTAENLIGLALAAGLIVFLIAALLFPERFQS